MAHKKRSMVAIVEREGVYNGCVVEVKGGRKPPYVFVEDMLTGDTFSVKMSELRIL